MQEEKNLVYYIRKYIFAINQNFKSTLKKISFVDLQEMLQDLDDMLTEYYKQEPEQCSRLARISYLPIIKKMFDIDRTDTYKGNYQKYMRNAYRMSSYSSLEHYMIYREWEETEKFYLPRIAIMQGYIHYLQELVNPESKVRLVVCNMPSGYGKTYPEKISEAWAFGRDPTGTVLSLCSNVDVVRGGSRTVIDEIKSEAFGSVFLKMKYSEDDKKYFLKETEDNWKLRDCKLVASYYANTVNSNVVGIRASQRIHIDDLYADYKEAMNQSTNELFFNRFLTVWRKRFVQNKEPRVVVTGTLWASGDFIAQIIDLEERDHIFVPDSMYKFTRVSQDGSVVIIQVPALDYETGLSTCPELRTTQEILKEKENMDEYLFETNFQQRPVDPESLEFSYKVLRTYRELPKKQDYESGAYSVIDATRKSGKDFFAMPIHRKILTEDGSYDYPLVDCIFTKTATKDLYLDVVNKIIEHHIILLIIESNVTSELKQNLEQILDSYGIYFCEIREKYNTIPKETRIDMEKSVIRRKIIFPVRELYPLKSDMGLFMDNLTLYNSTGRNINDDACFEKGTMIATQFGDIPIEKVKKGMKVITPFGLKKVVACGITGQKEVINKFGLNATRNHKVFSKTKHKFAPLDSLTLCEETDKLSLGGMIEWKKKLLNLMAKYTKGTQKADTTLNMQPRMKVELADHNYIEQYGNTTMVKYPKGIKYIIKTITLIITAFLTWSVYWLGNICRNIQKKIGKSKNIEKNTQNRCVEIAQYNKNVENGIEVKKEESGTKNTQKNQYLLTNLEKKENVAFVEKNTLQKQTEQNTVLQDVNKKQQTCKDHKFVKCVGKPFLQQHIEQKLVQENVKIVYNLKVENAGCYYANGILVSNCDSEAMFGSEIIEEGSKPQRITVIKRPF